jgi:carbonic anhydrase
MRSYIAALLSAVALADTSGKTKPSGGYNYNEGGENWGAYYPDMENNICGLATSKEQSPIDLPTDSGYLKDDKDMDIKVEGLGENAVESLDYETANHEVNWHFNFGSWNESAKVTRTAADTKVETFTPLQIHWHTPSENTVDGKHYAAEAHLVSQGANGDYAVVGYFFDPDVGNVTNDFVKSFLTGFDERNNADEDTKAKIDMSLLKN